MMSNCCSQDSKNYEHNVFEGIASGSRQKLTKDVIRDFVSKMSIVTGNKIPYYIQVAHSINRRIKSGVYEKNSTLPSVRTLCGEFGVSVNVIQRALRHLEKDGLIIAHAGKGVMLVDKASSTKSAILFGLIHPFPADLVFEQQVLHFAEEVFSSRDNLLIVRSSKLDVNNEREIAENLIHNGIQGLLLWPNASNPNGAYFTKMAEKLPIVLIDRLIPGAELAAVVFDSVSLGENICKYAFETLKRERLLAIIDSINISPHTGIVNGLRSQAEDMGRRQDVTIIYENILETIQKIGHKDYSKVDFCKSSIRKILIEGKYDTIFCPQGDFIDQVLIQTGLYDEFPELKLITTTTGNLDFRTRKFVESNPSGFLLNFPKIISKAADNLQRFVLTRTYNSKVIVESILSPSE